MDCRGATTLLFFLSMNESAADRFITEIVTLKNIWREDRSPDNYHALVNYLVEHHDELERLVDSVFTRLDESQRDTLQREHRELDGAVVTDGFRGIADVALVTAKHSVDPQNKHMPDGFFEVSYDNVEMLLRALRYAKYIE